MRGRPWACWSRSFHRRVCAPMSGLLSPLRPDAKTPRVRWQRLHASATALALAEAAGADHRPWVVIEADLRSLERRRSEGWSVLSTMVGPGGARHVALRVFGLAPAGLGEIESAVPDLQRHAAVQQGLQLVGLDQGGGRRVRHGHAPRE